MKEGQLPSDLLSLLFYSFLLGWSSNLTGTVSLGILISPTSQLSQVRIWFIIIDLSIRGFYGNSELLLVEKCTFWFAYFLVHMFTFWKGIELLASWLSPAIRQPSVTVSEKWDQNIYGHQVILQFSTPKQLSSVKSVNINATNWLHWRSIQIQSTWIKITWKLTIINLIKGNFTVMNAL